MVRVVFISIILSVLQLVWGTSLQAQIAQPQARFLADRSLEFSSLWKSGETPRRIRLLAQPLTDKTARSAKRYAPVLVRLARSKGKVTQLHTITRGLDASQSWKARLLARNKTSRTLRSRAVKVPGISAPTSQLPPIPGGAYLGIHIEKSSTSLGDALKTLESNVRIVGIFVGADELVDLSGLQVFLGEARDSGVIPMITLMTPDGADTLSDITLTKLATFLGEYERPIFLRYNHEMNGSWYRWGQSPELYQAAFRKIADTIHSVATNVAMVWAPNQAWGYPWQKERVFVPKLPASLDTNGDGEVSEQDDPYAPYYPGDSYVDWIGISAFHFGANVAYDNRAPAKPKWAAMNGIGATGFSIQEFSNRHQKPLMLAETGAAYVPSTSSTQTDSEEVLKKAWLSQVLNLDDTTIPTLEKGFAEYKAFVFFNIDKAETSDTPLVAWSLTHSPAVKAFFQTISQRAYFSEGTY